MEEVQTTPIALTDMAARTPAETVPVQEMAHVSECKSLILLMDNSSSVENNWYNQYASTAQAVTDPEVLEAMLGDGGWVAARAAHFSGNYQPLTPWHVIQDAASAETFAEALKARAGQTAIDKSNGTRIGNGLKGALDDLANSPCQDDFKVVDISTDGDDHSAPHTRAQRDRAFREGVRVNGIAVRGDYSTPEQAAQHLRDHVATGFVKQAEWDDYPQILKEKMQLEMAQAPAVGPLEPSQTPLVQITDITKSWRTPF